MSKKMEQRIVNTTTFVVESIQDYSILEDQFQLERYLIPATLYFQKKKNPTIFGRVHNAFRNQLIHPYKSFTFDTLDGEHKKQWAFYALYPKDATIIDVNLPWHNAEPLQHKKIHFRDLPRHILLKLLQNRFFGGVESNRFIGHDKCYVYARSGKDENILHCVEIEVKGAKSNREGDYQQEFRVIPSACRFGQVKNPPVEWDALFGKYVVGNAFFFRQLHASVLDKETAIYQRVTFPNQRAGIKYHDARKPHAGRGKITLDFIQQFLVELANFGIEATIRQRTFEAAPLPKETLLPVEKLGTIGVYDNRLRRDNALQEYCHLFHTLISTIQFVPIDTMSSVPQGGALVLLDATSEDFEEEGILYGEHQDPYSELYQLYPEIPKQSLIVNPNDSEALEGCDYLDYPMLSEHDEDLKRHLDVSLGQLYLKSAILQNSHAFPLPEIPKEMAFVLRANHKGSKYTVAMWFEHDLIRFAHLDNPEDCEPFYKLVDAWGVQWDEQYGKLLTARKYDKDENEDLPTYQIIVGRNLFVAIEDLQERVLYDYEKIVQRQQELKRPYPITHFQLVPHYNELQKIRHLAPLDELIHYIQAKQVPKTKKAQLSLAFYKQLQAYDIFLKEVEVTHPVLAYNQLTSGEWLERISRIFGSKKSKEGKYHRRLIIGIYQDVGKFLSEKGKDVHLYQGIWHDQTNAFQVGSPNGIKDDQERAHLIRRFQILQGENHFSKEQFLRMMGVQFVRHHQYTVLPYHFHLIKLYVENVLLYTRTISKA